MKSRINSDKKYVLVSDFDGTISKKDFFAYVTQTILSTYDLQPWLDYKSGLISHVEALNRIFQKIRLPIDRFHDFIDTIEIEEYFEKTVYSCLSSSIKVYVVSAGADYYISRILDRLKLTDKVELITNPSSYSESRGLELFPFCKEHKYYDKNLGVSKKIFVESLKEDGYTVIFAGDGMPDIAAASVADIVFAKDYLIELCDRQNITYTKIDSYETIYNFIQKL